MDSIKGLMTVTAKHVTTAINWHPFDDSIAQRTRIKTNFARKRHRDNKTKKYVKSNFFLVISDSKIYHNPRLFSLFLKKFSHFSIFPQIIPNKSFQTVTHLICIGEVSGSNIGQDIYYFDIFRVFPQSLRANPGIVL
jgi:hypothetical protein